MIPALCFRWSEGGDQRLTRLMKGANERALLSGEWLSWSRCRTTSVIEGTSSYDVCSRMRDGEKHRNHASCSRGGKQGLTRPALLRQSESNRDPRLSGPGGLVSLAPAVSTRRCSRLRVGVSMDSIWSPGSIFSFLVSLVKSQSNASYMQDTCISKIPRAEIVSPFFIAPPGVISTRK